jgi:hypothetical protein
MSMTNQLPDASKMVLSPNAQAVEDAYFNADGFGYRNGLAAALKAAADQVVPNLPRPTEEGTRQFDTDIDYWEDCQQHRASLLAIADELEGIKYGTYRCALKNNEL